MNDEVLCVCVRVRVCVRVCGVLNLDRSEITGHLRYMSKGLMEIEMN
jgi:hypothetical protein